MIKTKKYILLTFRSKTQSLKKSYSFNDSKGEGGQYIDIIYDKAPFIIYADSECLIEKIDRCKNNFENSSTLKVGKHVPSGFSMSTISSFKSIENKDDICRGKDCMKKFFESLREHTMKIIKFKKKKMSLLTKGEQESYENAKICYICTGKLQDKYATDKKYRKVRDHCHYASEYRGFAYSMCNLKFSVPKEIPIVFHNVSNYDYYFIVKELGEEFEGQFTCLGECTEKYVPFSVPIEKYVTSIDKKWGKNKKNHILQISVY